MDYLKIWTSFIEVIEPLNDAERGRLFTAMLVYADTGEVIEFKGNERYTWPIAKQGIDQAVQKVETLRQNGSKGGRPLKAEESKNNQTKPNETKENQTKANERLNVKDNIKDNIKENTNLTVSIKEKRTRFSPPTVEEVEAYCKERGNRINPQTFVDFYSAKGWRVGQNPMKDWKACVRTWEQRDSAQPAQRAKVLRAQDYQQREYKESEMAAALGVNDLFREDAG